MALVEPDTVTIRSGHEPSEMLIFAPDCKWKIKYTIYVIFEYFGGCVDEQRK